VIICEFIGFCKVQTAEQKQSKLPNKNSPNCRTKTVQTAERKQSKLPKSFEKVLIFNKKVLSLQCEIIVLKNYKK
jgi:ABC-type enterochelin transport system substrate-binding protein